MKQSEDLGLVKYDAMCKAIAACHQVDEVKDIRDKARALEVYAKQAQNREAERKANEVRLRAERRAGELLKEMKQAGRRQDRGDNRKMSRASTSKLQDLNITRDQASQWQQLAEVPVEQFEAELAQPGKLPTTHGLIQGHRIGILKPLDIDKEALWFWGRLCDCERDRIFARDPKHLIAAMTEPMKDDVKRILPQLYTWLERLGE